MNILSAFLDEKSEFKKREKVYNFANLKWQCRNCQAWLLSEDVELFRIKLFELKKILLTACKLLFEKLKIEVRISRFESCECFWR